MQGGRKVVATLLLWIPLVIFVLFCLSGVLLASMGMDVHWTSKEAPYIVTTCVVCSFAPAWRQVSNCGRGQRLEASYRQCDFAGASLGPECLKCRIWFEIVNEQTQDAVATRKNDAWH